MSDLWVNPKKPIHRMQGTVTVRKSIDTPVRIEASGNDPEAVIWDLVKQGIGMLAKARDTAPSSLQQAKAEVEIETGHFTITIKWSRAGRPGGTAEGI